VLLNNVCNIVILLWGCVMVSLGICMMLFPEIVIENYGLQASGSIGWSAISGNFSSLICFLGLAAVLGVSTKNRFWLFNVLIVESLILMGRGIAIIQHGYSVEVAVLLVAEILIAVIIVVQIKIEPLRKDPLGQDSSISV